MADTGWKSPTNTGEDYNQWANPTNAYSSDDFWATELTLNQKQDYYDFTFGVPAGATIDGIEVSLEAKHTQPIFGDGIIGVEMSWDGGTNYTSDGKNTGALTGTDVIYVLGGAADTWGRAWSDGEFSNANFRVYVNADALPFQGTDDLDHIQVKVYYTEVAVGTNMQVNIADVFKDIDAIKINIGDVWKNVVAIKINIGDVWKTVFG